jgi:hypothetical protein
VSEWYAVAGRERREDGKVGRMAKLGTREENEERGKGEKVEEGRKEQDGGQGGQ